MTARKAKLSVMAGGIATQKHTEDITTLTPRVGRGKAKASIQMIAAACRILSEIQPATVRAVCYRLFTEKVIDNMSKANTNKVGGQLVYTCRRAHIQGF